MDPQERKHSPVWNKLKNYQLTYFIIVLLISLEFRMLQTSGKQKIERQSNPTIWKSWSKFENWEKFLIDRYKVYSIFSIFRHNFEEIIVHKILFFTAGNCQVEKICIG